MSSSKQHSRRSNPDIDISMPNAKQKTSWAVYVAIWATVLCAFTAMFYFETPFEWVVGTILLAGVGVLGGWFAWVLLVRRGALTWMRLAFKPAKLYAAGDTVGADAALARAIARANRFAPGSHPRGMMLEPIAEYLGNQGRSDEAKAAFEECTETLARFIHSNPMDYFIALNNYAVFLLWHKDFEAAQHILERVLDLALSAKKRNDGSAAIVTITEAQLQTIQFVLHLNLVCVFLEMQEIEAMRYHLFETESYFESLPKGTRKQFHDHFLALRSRCLFERKKYEAAWKLLDDAADPHNLNVVRMRGRLHLHDGEYAEAESCLLQYETQQRKTCVDQHPQHLELRLYLAECQYHLGQLDAAYASLAEARNLVEDFSLPRDRRWHDKLRPWLERAERDGRADLAKAIAEEMRQTQLASETAIVVLERFRAQRPQEPRTE